MRLLVACASPGDAALERLLAKAPAAVLARAEELHAAGLLVDWEITVEGARVLASAAPFTGNAVAKSDGARRCGRAA